MLEIKEGVKLENVKQSQLGMFINLIHKDVPAENIMDMVHLAKLISEGFNVNSQARDIEEFYELDNSQENF